MERCVRTDDRAASRGLAFLDHSHICSGSAFHFLLSIFIKFFSNRTQFLRSSLLGLANVPKKFQKLFFQLVNVEPNPFLLLDGMDGISNGFELARDRNNNILVYLLPWPLPECEQPSSHEISRL